MAAALGFVELMEQLEFDNFKVSMKSTSVPNTIASNRMLTERIPYPLHLGITEAGHQVVRLPEILGRARHAARRRDWRHDQHLPVDVPRRGGGQGRLGDPQGLKLRERGPVLIACPTCGRLQFDMDTVVAEIERRLEAYEDPIEVSVLGCAVNGIGEARHADFGITGAKDAGEIYSKGKLLRKVKTEDLVDELFEEIDKYYAAGKRVVRDERAAAEAEQWLAEHEDTTAMTPERMAALEAEAADGAEADEPGRVRLDEDVSPVAGRRFTRA